MERDHFQVAVPIVTSSYDCHSPRKELTTTTSDIQSFGTSILPATTEYSTRPVVPPVAPHQARVLRSTSDVTYPTLPFLPLASRHGVDSQSTLIQDSNCEELRYSPQSSPLHSRSNSNRLSKQPLSLGFSFLSPVVRHLFPDQSSILSNKYNIRLLHGLACSDHSYSINQVTQKNCLAELATESLLHYFWFFRTPYPVISNSLPVQAELENERLWLFQNMARGTRNHFTSGKTTMKMRSQDHKSISDLLWGGGEGEHPVSNIQGGGCVGIAATESRGNGRDWLHSGYENLTGPPPKWRQSALFRMGKDVDFDFMENSEKVYLNENLKQNDVVQMENEFESKTFWSESEIAQFIQRYLATPKDFKRIAQAMLPSFGSKGYVAPELAKGSSISHRDCRMKTEVDCAVRYMNKLLEVN